MRNKDSLGFLVGQLIGMVVVIGGTVMAIMAYIRHIFWLFQVFDKADTTMGEIALAIVGAVIPFIGMINGVCLWLS